jgi:hypothetical protein
VGKYEAAQKRVEALLAEAQREGLTIEGSVPFDDQNALARDRSEADAFMGEYDPEYERRFYAQRAKDLAGDRSEQRNLWSRGR